MNKGMQVFAAAALALLLVCGPAIAAERVEEATVIGKDKSEQAGVVPSDTRAAPAESKMKKEEAPTGLKSGSTGVRTGEKMEKPKMADKDREKPEGKKGLFGGAPIWMWILILGAIAAAAG